MKDLKKQQTGKSKSMQTFWDHEANQFKTSPLATMKDYHAQVVELKNVISHLKGAKHVLDIGCGNGYPIFQYAAVYPKMTFTGVDFSPVMVEKAQKALEKKPQSMRHRVTFAVGDMLDLPFEDGSFDTVVTCRAVINLLSWGDQKKSLKEIHRVLRPRGNYVMCECFREGLDNLNVLRRAAGLYTIPEHRHSKSLANLYLREKALLPFAKTLFRLKSAENFSSTYYIASRIFNAKLAQLSGEEPRYDSPINAVAAKLPALGEYGLIKTFVFEKKA